MSTILIRPGEKEDLPAVLQLIKELASYERAPEEVEVSVEELERDGFGPERVFEFFVAVDNGRISGVAIFYTRFSTWKGRCIYLEDLVVKESDRGKGYGKKLFEAVMQLSLERGCRLMTWQVLDWNEPAINFYRRYGATMDPEWLNGRLLANQIEKFFQDSSGDGD